MVMKNCDVPCSNDLYSSGTRHMKIDGLPIKHGDFPELKGEPVNVGLIWFDVLTIKYGTIPHRIHVWYIW